MMNSYYYLLFQIYWFYKKQPSDSSLILLNVTMASSALWMINLLSVILMLNYFDLLNTYSINTQKTALVGLWILSCIFNYIIFVRKQKFLNRQYFSNKQNERTVIAMVSFSLFLFLLIGLLAHWNKVGVI